MSERLHYEQFTTGGEDGQRRFNFHTTDKRKAPVQGSLFWKAAVLRGEDVVAYLSKECTSPEEALAYAHRESIVFPDATHVRASNGIDNVVERV
jgi:hypothetical protein